MPVVRMPDGTRVKFPDNMPDEKIRGYIATKFPDAVKQPSPEPVADPTGGGAALTNVVNTATFGLAPKALAAVEAGLSHITPGPTETYDEALANVRNQQQRETGAHPVAATVGDIVGLGLGAGELSAAAKAAETVPVAGRAAKAVNSALELRKGQSVKNVARLAATGAAASGAQDALEGGSPADIAMNAGVGAVVGPVGSYAVQGAVRAAAPLSSKVAAVLSRTVGESVSDLQKAWVAFQRQTGRVPTMAEIADLKTAGEIKKLAQDSPAIGASLSQAEQTAAAERSANLASKLATDAQGNPIPGSKELAAANTAAADTEFGNLRNRSFSLSPEDSDFLISEVMPNVKTSRLARQTIANELESGSLSINSADIIRRNLRAQARSKPGEGFHEMANDLDAIVGNAVPEYKQAVKNYADRAQGVEGAALGEKIANTTDTSGFISDVNTASPLAKEGSAKGAQSAARDAAQSPEGALRLVNKFATDQGFYDRVKTVAGQDAADSLRRLAQAESQGAERFAQVSPRTPRASSEASADDANNVLHAVAVVSPHGSAFWKVFHIGRLVNGAHMSPQVQDKVAEYLSNPKMTRQAINLLRKAGANDAAIRRLAIRAATASGLAAGQLTTGG